MSDVSSDALVSALRKMDALPVTWEEGPGSHLSATINCVYGRSSNGVEISITCWSADNLRIIVKQDGVEVFNLSATKLPWESSNECRILEQKYTEIRSQLAKQREDRKNAAVKKFWD